jgi:GNAT superfamily N-acetyltransferase
MTTDLTINTFRGADIKPYLPELANLRIQVFREYPYLYEGDIEYETKYLSTYLNAPDGLIVVVFAGSQVVGASTAIPMRYEPAECQKPFIENSIAIEDVCYFGESILLPAYRGQGIYPIFFQERERAAISFGSKIATFCAVNRAEHDPRRPANYVALNNYWERAGYSMHPELNTYFEWKEIGEQTTSPKKMIFWLKQL